MKKNILDQVFNTLSCNDLCLIYFPPTNVWTTFPTLHERHKGLVVGQGWWSLGCLYNALNLIIYRYFQTVTIHPGLMYKPLSTETKSKRSIVKWMQENRRENKPSSTKKEPPAHPVSSSCTSYRHEEKVKHSHLSQTTPEVDHSRNRH